MTIGVVLVTYNASDIILPCVESLLESLGAQLRIVVVDNASQDDTPSVIQTWAADSAHLSSLAGLASNNAQWVDLKGTRLGLITLPENEGFAAGVNAGLKALHQDQEVDFFWILNPDCTVPPNTPGILEACARAAGRFGAIGGRVLYMDDRDMIQSDGGWVNMWTGICTPRNLGRKISEVSTETERPLDFIGGGHMLVSREFVARAGYMPEDYFLYYEEVDWCLRRGDLRLIFQPEAVVYHHGGHSIGSATMARGPSPLSAYFLNRGRMKFIMRHRPLAAPIAWLYSFARAGRALLKGQTEAGWAAIRGITWLPPTTAIFERIGRKSLPK